MGKTTIIGGNYTEIVRGDKKMYAGGNITFKAGKKLVQYGEEGIYYGDPKKLHDDNTSNSLLTVSLNMFFDGTRNNKNNTQARLDNNAVYKNKGNKEDDSYENDFSNIAKGYDAIDPDAGNQVAVYIEGIGTVDDKADDKAQGPGFGIGDRGIRAKAVKGCREAAKALSEKYKKRPKIDLLEVNVFGFSRGAAAARHFVHIATSPCIRESSGHIIKTIKVSYIDYEDKGGKIIHSYFNIKSSRENLKYIDKNGYLGACLLKEGLDVKEIQFNFAGLYDTVASFGFNHKGNWLVESDAKQLNLDAVSKCNFTLQLASADEFRENFSLTNINKCGLNGLELTLPGVHSDIGGGYVEGAEEVAYIYEETHVDRGDAIKKFGQFLIREGWFAIEQLFVVDISRKKLPFSSILDKNYILLSLEGKRKLSNEYAKIPLNIMIEYSEKRGVKYDEKKLNDKKEISNPNLKKVYKLLREYADKCKEIRNTYVRRYNKGERGISRKYIEEVHKVDYRTFLKDEDFLYMLRNKYFHWSSNASNTINGIVHKPRISTAEPHEKRKRYIIDG